MENDSLGVFWPNLPGLPQRREKDKDGASAAMDSIKKGV
jgi:hypothetical protein